MITEKHLRKLKAEWTKKILTSPVFYDCDKKAFIKELIEDLKEHDSQFI